MAKWVVEFIGEVEVEADTARDAVLEALKQAEAGTPPHLFLFARRADEVRDRTLERFARKTAGRKSPGRAG